jgi:hypothetical protein
VNVVNVVKQEDVNAEKAVNVVNVVKQEDVNAVMA